MQKRNIFISSVQSEFSEERKALSSYISADPLLGKFFEPFLFEQLPAIDQRADELYLNEIAHCDIYLGLFGKAYGSGKQKDFSPTEQEFDEATKLHKTRLIFLTNDSPEQRDARQNKLIAKAQEVVVRRKFNHVEELKSAVYASLVRYLEEQEIIRTSPFDASFHPKAGLEDIDTDKLQSFVKLAQLKRGFPLPETASAEQILTHLNLYDSGRLTHAALLLFGKAPQRYFINSEVRCASFAGYSVQKPIPSYKVFKGNLFELVDQALEFALNKLDYRIETRAEQVSIPGSYEIPMAVVAEAIVNAIAHRDYTSNASVQVMVFRDRLEILNPGALPIGWTTEKLKQLHNSVPANPLIAQPLYLAGYIERMGTGTTDILEKCLSAGLQEPQFIQTEEFRTILYRAGNEQAGEQVGEQVGEQAGEQVKVLLLITNDEMSVLELMTALNLKGRRNFLQHYLYPALEAALMERTQPEAPKSPKQKYRLTTKGMAVKARLIKQT
jgi:ATP-dependent DNA helicase RecG